MEMAQRHRKLEQPFAITGENVIELPVIRWRKVTFGNSLKIVTVPGPVRYVPSSTL
jgi:hypothetical protein